MYYGFFMLIKTVMMIHWILRKGRCTVPMHNRESKNPKKGAPPMNGPKKYLPGKTPGKRFELLRCRAPVAFKATALPGRRLPRDVFLLFWPCNIKKASLALRFCHPARMDREEKREFLSPVFLCPHFLRKSMQGTAIPRADTQTLPRGGARVVTAWNSTHYRRTRCQRLLCC